MARSLLISVMMIVMMMVSIQAFLLPIGKHTVSSSSIHYSSHKTVLYADGGASIDDGGAVESCRRKIQDALQPVELIVSQSVLHLSYDLHIARY